MAKFKETDSKQNLFVAVNLRQQLIPGTFEWTIDYLIDKIDISLFECNYKNDYSGAAAYSPKVLLKIILFCYSKGIISSRKIEKTCRENIIDLFGNPSFGLKPKQGFLQVLHFFRQKLCFCLTKMHFSIEVVQKLKFPNNSNSESIGRRF